MQNNEWSLISFTLLTQFGVGLILFISVIFFWNQQIFSSFSPGFSFNNPELLVLTLTLIATIISFLHLGKPLNAANALNNLSGSWISKEILGLSLFGFSVLFIFLSRWLLLSAAWLTPFSLLLSSVFGILLIFSMLKIYMLPTVPSWNSLYTPVSFYTSAIILGLGGVLFFVILKFPLSFEYHTIKLISFILLSLIILLIIEAVFSGLHYMELSEMDNTGIEKPDFGSGMFLKLFIIRTLLSFAASAAFLFVLLKYGNPSFSPDLIKLIVISGVVLIASEQIIGRYLFYASYFRLGV